MLPRREALSREETNKVLSLLKGLEQMDESVEFLHPVDYKGLGLDDYPLIIKIPMDLSTVKKKVKAAKYQETKEALADIQMIWDNCRTYNMSDSVRHRQAIAKQADIMEKHTKRLCGKLKIEYDVPKARKRNRDDADLLRTGEIKFEEKVDFCERVKQATFETLSKLVKRVQDACPQAAESLDEDKVQIKVDLLDRETFNELFDMVCAFRGEEEEDTPGKRTKLE